MPRSIGNDERAPVRCEKSVGHIDRDALLALSLKPIDKQSEIDVLADRAVTPRIALECNELIFEDKLRVIQEAADQRRLPVIDRSARQKSQELFLPGRFHQK